MDEQGKDRLEAIGRLGHAVFCLSDPQGDKYDSTAEAIDDCHAALRLLGGPVATDVAGIRRRIDELAAQSRREAEGPAGGVPQIDADLADWLGRMAGESAARLRRYSTENDVDRILLWARDYHVALKGRPPQ